MKSVHPGSGEHLHITIEQDGKKYKVETDQLDRIGDQLRGRRHFSIFNSIVLPVIVTVLTTLLTGLFQYVSWTNSVRLQNATDQAIKASETLEHAAAAIGKRRYASLLFIPTIRDLVGMLPENRLQLVDATKDNPTLPRSLAPATTETSVSLHTLTHQLLKARYESYYQHLKSWNETYDQILTDIDYNLDRPILLQARIHSEPISVFQDKFKRIDCSQSLTGQLDSLGLHKHSLKLQFAVIHHCFAKLNTELGNLTRRTSRLEQVNLDKANLELGHVHTMANEFRCYGQRRFDYYRRQKELSILSPQLVVRRLLNSQKTDALEHFTFEADRCKPETRPT